MNDTTGSLLSADTASNPRANTLLSIPAYEIPGTSEKEVGSGGPGGPGDGEWWGAGTADGLGVEEGAGACFGAGAGCAWGLGVAAAVPEICSVLLSLEAPASCKEHSWSSEKRSKLNEAHPAVDLHRSQQSPALVPEVELMT